MLDQVVNLSNSGIDLLKDLLTKKLDCKDYPGENIKTVAKNVWSIIKHLQANKAAPHDLLKVIFHIFKTTSIPEFNQWVAHWSNSISHLPKSKHPEFNKVLNKIIYEYRQLCQIRKWTMHPFQHKKKTVQMCPQKRKRSHLEMFIVPLPQEKRLNLIQIIIVMKWCGACHNKVSKSKGHWNTTHFTKQHQGKKKSDSESGNIGESSTPTATTPKIEKSSDKKKVSFADAVASQMTSN